jgi:hypothetical protein
VALLRNPAVLITALVLLWMSPGGAATDAVDLIGLTGDNVLILFNSAHSTEARRVKIGRIRSALLGIDYRPADRKLYGGRRRTYC